MMERERSEIEDTFGGLYGHKKGDHMRLGCSIGVPPRSPPRCECKTFEAVPIPPQGAEPCSPETETISTGVNDGTTRGDVPAVGTTQPGHGATALPFQPSPALPQ